jgi:hypothetical protein
MRCRCKKDEAEQHNNFANINSNLMTIINQKRMTNSRLDRLELGEPQPNIVIPFEPSAPKYSILFPDVKILMKFFF